MRSISTVVAAWLLSAVRFGSAWDLELHDLSDVEHLLDTRNNAGGPSYFSCGDIETALQPELSENATIILPGGTDFKALEIRAGSPRVKPIFSAIVEPVTEQDVQTILRYTDKCDIPFLVVNGAHGWQSTINNANGGLAINVRKMSQISLSDDGSSVTVAAGVIQNDFVQTLYKLDKWTTSGLCECTSIIGPLMGGGHSAIQGFYGFVSDNIISARVVLANGECVTASDEENPDLFWALKGAGHNFGVVTSFEMKAYDLPKTNWLIVTFLYTQDKLEDFVDALNEVDNHGDHDPEMNLQGAITHIPAVDPKNPAIAYQISYLGSNASAKPYVDRFKQAGPLAVTYADVPYSEYYDATNNGAFACRKNLNQFGYSVSLHEYNKTAMRTTYNLFAEMTSDSRFNTSAWLLESYGSRGVWAQNYSASAVPAAERNLPVLTVPITWWNGNSPELTERANYYGKAMRTALAAGEGETYDEPHVYVNYAVGSESLDQMYGPARVPELQALKKKWDPENKFRFYMPLIAP